ncbi:MAG: hypothetical protein ACLQNE_21700 [Thermoguttaceae bacterium]
MNETRTPNRRRQSGLRTLLDVTLWSSMAPTPDNPPMQDGDASLQPQKGRTWFPILLGVLVVGVTALVGWAAHWLWEMYQAILHCP